MTALLAEYPPEFIEPAHLWVPPGARGTYGPEVVRFVRSIGHDVDAEQAADIGSLATYGPGGTYLTLESAYIEARQNGKTDRVGLSMAMFDVWIMGASVTWTAHRVETVAEVFATVQRLIKANDSLSSRVDHIVEQQAAWAVVCRPKPGQLEGAVFEFRVRGPGGGRGIPRDIWVIDEALFVQKAAMGDRLPTLSSKPNPQVRYLSSACKEESTQLRKIVRRGRARNDRSLILVERCAPGSFADPGCERGVECRHTPGVPGCVLDRQELWHYGNHRIGRRPGASYQFIGGERRTLAAVEFARERYGWHEDGPTDDDLRHPLDQSGWAATVVDQLPEGLNGPMFFVTIGPDGIPVVGVASDRPVLDIGSDPRPHTELADRVTVANLPARLAELALAWPHARFGAGAAGPVGGLVKAGLVERVDAVLAKESKGMAAPFTMELLPSAEIAASCGHLEKLIKSRGFTRSADGDVESGFSGAVSKPVGDGMWSWNWRDSVGLAPLAAVAGSLWLLEKHRGNVAHDAWGFFS